MRPGAGGDCHRHPAAAIGRMRRGDALVSVQEYSVTDPMREHLRRSFPPLGVEPRLGRLHRAWVGPEDDRRTLTTTIPFSAHGRAFDALVYFHGRPTAARREEVASILAAMRFEAR
jgi:hypothetical protein